MNYLELIKSELESERLIIRKPRADDWTLFLDSLVYSQNDILKYNCAFVTEIVTETIKKKIDQYISTFDLGKRLQYFIFSKHNDQFLGGIALNNIDWSVPKFSFGYWLDSRHIGNGFMTEAVETMTRYCFEVLKAHRVEIMCYGENVKSINVAKKFRV
jgi:RimJ/RimL family protein N-acetyltransferase